MFFDSCEIYHNFYHFLNLLGINQSRTVENMGKNSVTPPKYRKHFVKKSCNECHKSQTNDVITDTRSWTDNFGFCVSNSLLLANECLKSEVRVVQVNLQGALT